LCATKVQMRNWNEFWTLGHSPTHQWISQAHN
jgi:hypothetical protein